MPLPVLQQPLPLLLVVQILLRCDIIFLAFTPRKYLPASGAAILLIYTVDVLLLIPRLKGILQARLRNLLSLLRQPFFVLMLARLISLVGL